MTHRDFNLDKSVKVPAALVPTIKRLIQRYHFLVCAEAREPSNAAALISCQYDNSQKLNSELNSKLNSEKIKQVRDIVQRYRENQKPTRDWTQAGRLIDELSKLLEIE